MPSYTTGDTPLAVIQEYFIVFILIQFEPFLPQKLALVLYKAAQDGDIDAFRVSQILDVTQEEARVDDRKSVSLSKRPGYLTQFVNSRVIPGRAHRMLNGACRNTPNMVRSAGNLTSEQFYDFTL